VTRAGRPQQLGQFPQAPDGLITDRLAVRDDVALLRQVGAIADHLPRNGTAE
jgi:hypothetical protein